MVLTIDSLSYVRDQVQVVLYLSFTLLELIAIFTSLHPILLNGLLSASNLRPVFPRDFLKLLFLELLDLILVVVNVLMNLLLEFECHALIGLKCIFFKTVTDSQFSLQQLDFGTVVSFVVVIALDAANNFLTHFLIGFELLLVLGDEVAVHGEPLIILYVVLFRDIFLLH